MNASLSRDLLQRYPPPSGVEPGAWKVWLNALHEDLSGQFDTQDIATLITARAELIDHALQQLWQAHQLHDTNRLALLAVGGYGRGELHPYSDIDILAVHDGHIDLEVLTPFFQTLWDSGLKLSQSVRTPQQCRADARDDIGLMTSWMERRFLCGSTALNDDVNRKLTHHGGAFRAALWEPKKFFYGKVEEREQRHAQFGGGAYLLEPNLKEGPGGLRDIQTVHWILQRHDHITDAAAFCDAQELAVLNDGREFLWRTRFALHDLSGHAEERLHFGNQHQVAQRLGYNGTNVNETIEAFMQDYYRTTSEVDRLSEVLVQQYREQLQPATRYAPQPFNDCFQILDGYLETRAEDSFERHPEGLLELFLILQQAPHIQGVRAHTIRAVRAHLSLIDDAFRSAPRHRQIFLEILRQKQHVAREMRRMHRYGVLAAYWPDFARITGKVQHDLFHIYPVDEHILQVLTEMRRIARSGDPQYALFEQLFLQFPKPELLYLAALFHDIGKGRGGDHSTLGAEDAQTFCLEHGLSEYDAGIVRWLVQHHLLMSMTAQKRDTSDPEVIREFADQVGNGVRLRGLFLLTVADLRGTNPSLWTPWRESLLYQLYRATNRQLQRGSEQIANSEQRLNELKASAMKRLPQHSAEAAKLLWDTMPTHNLLHYTDNELAWQTECILSCAPDSETQVFVRHQGSHHCTEILVYDQHHGDLFVPITATLARLAANVLYARITETRQQHILHTFLVTDPEGLPISEGAALTELRERLQRAVRAPSDSRRPVRLRPRLQTEHFQVPTEVEFVQQEQPPETRLHLSTTDHPGLLWTISCALEECGVHIQQARITTLGAQAQDAFVITDASSQQPITHAQTLNKIEDSLQARIRQLQDSHNATAPETEPEAA